MDATRVSLTGDINEASTFGQLVELRGRVVFDMSGVRRVNSFGVRELLRFLTELSQNARIEAECCSPAIVSQLNMLPEFSSCVRVSSVQVPMECVECLHEGETNVMITSSDLPKMPATACNACGHAMEASEPEDRYFAFLEDV